MPNDKTKLQNLAAQTKSAANNNEVAIQKSQPTIPFVTDSKGKIINDLRNYTIFTEHDIGKVLKKNTVSGRIEIFGLVDWEPNNTTIRPWTDTDTCNCLMYANEYGLKDKKSLEYAIEIVADRHRYNPLTDYLESLEYKGKGFIRRLLVEYMGCEDSEYTFQVMKLLLLAMVQRAYHPGCKYDYVVILVGKQGTYKSTFWRVLARSDDWFTDSIDSFSDRKKVGEQIQGRWLVELGEMSAFKKSEIESIKACITTQTDSYREAYGHFRGDFNRTAIFVGTTNEKTFLKDNTGNRRFLVLHINEKKRTKDIFTCKTREEDFSGALAEALHIYKEMTKDGKLIPLILPQEVMQEAERLQSDSNYYEELTGIIAPWLEEQIQKNHRQTCAMDIWCNCLNKDRGNYANKDGFRINQILDSLPLWERSNSIRITLKTSAGYTYFDYRGRGYKYTGLVDKKEDNGTDFDDDS